MNLSTLSSGWNLMRVLRLAMGIIAGAQAIELRDPLLGLISAFFLYQAVMNTSCCGVAGCATPPARSNYKKTKPAETSYEEIK
ncbi:MAG: hypothetical protein ACKOW2_07055 [Sphingobacteriaceae bacterium]